MKSLIPEQLPCEVVSLSHVDQNRLLWGTFIANSVNPFFNQAYKEASA